MAVQVRLNVRCDTSGADASNPTAEVNFQDLRYRYFDLDDRAEKHSFETD
ncbi:MAG: hypothetical protein JSV14_01675 [Deltaproteobacteria bacterium]|nr:MAG: hypothetical protein JSV14_01675 [Deltaproteobacteria bacterium]